MSEIKRFPYPDAIDADGHVLEPPDMWEKNIALSVASAKLKGERQYQH